MADSFLLIPGRTSKQGCGISEGKFTDGYVAETSRLMVSPEDLQRLALEPGQRVRVSSQAGQIEVEVVAAKPGDLPTGVVFIPYGDFSSRLMGPDTDGSGMPTSKGIDVVLEKIP